MNTTKESDDIINKQNLIRQEIIKQYIWYRKIRNLTQEDLAYAMGIKRPNIIRFETGQCNPTLDLLVKMAECMDLEIKIELVDKSKEKGDEKNISLFYTNIENKEGIDEFFLALEEYAEKGINPVYIINRPLEEKNASYGYEKGIVVLIPKHKIMFINYGNNMEKFNDFYEDFVEDLGQLSKKYDYMKILGRPRQWKGEFTVTYNYEDVKGLVLSDFLEKNKLPSKEDARKGEFLISLLTGSINDVERTGIDYPDTVLEKIRRKIILFDGDQTRFIFDEPHKDRIVIQGLAGTGKTELLLNKIKELYLNKQELKIVFTCHNKILAENLRQRIPEFFDFMKVDEQIKWNEKLWVMSGWGSKSNFNSGVYSYICNYYNIPFERFSYSITFDKVCRRALQKLNEINNFEECFDYILIDKSQGFYDALPG